VPQGLSTRRALSQLRRLEPGAVFDYDHLYGSSASVPDAVTPTAETADLAPAPDGEPTRGVRRNRVGCEEPDHGGNEECKLQQALGAACGCRFERLQQ